jgi:hypothetical protein
MEFEPKRITNPLDLSIELENRLNSLYGGFKVTYDENKRTFDWINKDIHFHFDIYTVGRLYDGVNKSKSLLTYLIEHVYEANEFMSLTQDIKTKIETLINKSLIVSFVHMSNFNGAYSSYRQSFKFCPINLFHSFTSAKKSIPELSDYEHVSAVFSHEYGHHLFDLEHDDTSAISSFATYLKRLSYDEDTLLDKIKEYICLEEEDAWIRGQELALQLGVNPKNYLKRANLHLEDLKSRKPSAFKLRIYPYFKFKPKKAIQHSNIIQL